uniref:USP domain-containing protein n=1 Tax=Syphacia muris TaxID=451379 RepID=A0A0N5A9B1_9BILA
MNKVREAVQLMPEKRAEVQNGMFKIDGRYAHEDHLRIRLNFLHYLLSDGQLWLLAPQANELWDALVVNAVTDFERTYGFKLFEKMESRGDIDPKALNLFFETRILKFPVEELNTEGFQCFKVFWICVNQAAVKLTVQENSAQYSLVCMDLEGCDYLWEVILKSKEEVSRSAIDLWVEVFSKPDRIDVGILTESVINKCFIMLKENREMLNNDSINEDTRQQAIRHMGRILSALYNYICAFDDDFLLQERAHPPLMRSCMGQCFLLSVLLPNHELEKVHSHLDQRGSSLNFHFPASGLLSNSQNEECKIPVHSNMSLSAVRLLIIKKLRQLHPSLPSDLRFRLYVLRIGINSPEQIPLEAQGKRKTLAELFIDSNTQVVISFSFTHHILFGNRSPTSDSSLDESEEMSSVEEDTERMLPGCAIASNTEYVRFLCALADIGYTNSYEGLRQNAEKVLHQIPVDLMSVKSLEQMVENDSLPSNFSAEKPSETLYLLAVLHSLLLPAGGYLQKKATSFQKKFFSSNCCLSLLSFLDDPKILHLRDASSCCTTLWWILNITKFILSVIARLKVGIFGDVCTFLFLIFCDAVANDLYKCAVYKEITLQHLESFYFVKSPLLESLMRIAWICGSHSLPLNAAAVDSLKIVLTNEQFVSNTASPPMEVIGEQQEQLTICALDAVACASITDGASELILNNKYLWSSLITDLLFCSSSGIQSHVTQVVKRVICRESFPAVKETVTLPDSLAAITVKLLFEKFSYVDRKPDAASEYFSLLCGLLEYCRIHSINLDSKIDKIEKILNWLESAKQHTVINKQQYPNDHLLIGYFDLCRSLVNCLNSDDKLKIGSDEKGRKFVKQILDEFVLPFSRALVELRCFKRTNGSIVRRSTTQLTLAKNVCESEDSFSKSVTADPITTSHCVPVCGTNESVKAAYDLVISLCEDCPQNLFAVVKILMEMFYADPLSTNSIEWEYLPGFATRLPNNYVGLKNGGATCYMNSVFQQIFMIEELRNAVLNVKCDIGTDITDGEFDNYSNISYDAVHNFLYLACKSFLLFYFSMEKYGEASQDNYHQIILKSVQIIFAHLLGSELQFYTPKYFWDHFRFGGQAVNVREQQDALEFYNAIFDSIDEGLKAFGERPICEMLFGGTFADQKICKDCPHWYQREEAFTSISLDIRSHNNLIASLKEYVKGDLLNNDNAYFCEECGRKVTAVKRLCLAKLPPYLTIQLKRFDFDWERDLPQKYNDYFEFPLELDMMPYTAEGLASSEGISSNVVALSSDKDLPRKIKSTFYRLRGVTVHSGQANGGHYYSFIRSSDDGGQWYKFDDIDVTKWDLSKEEMRNMWFGGDYSSDSYEINNKSYQKRRQKRWWNAYLLIYEKVQGLSSEDSNVSNCLCHSLSSSTHGSVILHSSDGTSRHLQPTFLNKKLQEMPPKLEALIRGQNTRSMHEKSHGGNMNDWQKSLEYLLSASDECRMWFVCNILLQQKLIVSFLLSATAPDIRFFFAHIMISVLNLTRNDSIESLQHFVGGKSFAISDDLTELRIKNMCSLRDTVSDLLLSVLLIALRNNFSEFISHPTQYIFLLHQYASLGCEQKKQMVRKGVLHSLLLLIFEEANGFKASYHDSGKFFDLILQLIRTCDLGSSKSNPYALGSSDLEPVSSEVRSLLYDPVFLDKFVKQVLEMPSDHDNANEAVLFLCWENLPVSQIILWQLPFQSMFASKEVKQGTKIIESIVSINDSVKVDRLRYLLFGSIMDPLIEKITDVDPIHRSYLTTIFVQSGSSFWKTYIMLKSLVKIINENPEANQESFSYSCRSSEMKTSGLERSGSAKDLLLAIEKLDEKIAPNLKEENEEKAEPEAKHVVPAADDIETDFLDAKKYFWCPSTSILNEEWDEKQHYLSNSISADEKQNTLKNLPPPPKYSESCEIEHSLLAHHNSPVHLTASGDKSDSREAVKSVDNSNSSSKAVEIEKNIGEQCTVKLFQDE